jgi:hypothetical protein
LWIPKIPLLSSCLLEDTYSKDISGSYTKPQCFTFGFIGMRASSWIMAYLERQHSQKESWPDIQTV